MSSAVRSPLSFSGALLMLVGLLFLSAVISASITYGHGEGYRVYEKYYSWSVRHQIKYHYTFIYAGESVRALPGKLDLCLVLAPRNSILTTTIKSNASMSVFINVTVNSGNDVVGSDIIYTRPGTSVPVDLVNFTSRGVYIVVVNVTPTILLGGGPAESLMRYNELTYNSPVVYGPIAQPEIAAKAFIAILFAVILLAVGLIVSRREAIGFSGWVLASMFPVFYVMLLGALYGFMRPYEGVALCTGPMINLYIDGWSPGVSRELHNLTISYLLMESPLGPKGIPVFWVFLSAMVSAMAWGAVYESGVEGFEILISPSGRRIYLYKTLVPLLLSVLTPILLTLLLPLALYGFHPILFKILLGACLVEALVALGIILPVQAIVALIAIATRRVSVPAIASGLLAFLPVIKPGVTLGPVNLDVALVINRLSSYLVGHWGYEDRPIDYISWLSSVTHIAAGLVMSSILLGIIVYLIAYAIYSRWEY